MSTRSLCRLPSAVLSFTTRPTTLSRGIKPTSPTTTTTIPRRLLSLQALDDTRAGRDRIVILGSGWAGYTLSRSLDHRQYQVVVVSPRSYFVFTPLLASTSVGTLEFRNALEPVRSRRSRAEFFQGWADGVDFGGKILRVEESVHDPQQGLALTGSKGDDAVEERRKRVKKGQVFELGWDKLVVAVGCYSQTFGTPGVKENAFFLKDVGDARRIRNRMLACFETAHLPNVDEEVKRALLHFAVVGGGPTGIEFSAELHDLIREDMARLYPELMQYCKITVFDVAPQILSMFDKKLGDYAIDTFRREGIDVKTSHHVQELRQGLPKGAECGPEAESCFTIRTQEDGEVGVGMCVWSTGLMMNPFVEEALGKDVPTSAVFGKEGAINGEGTAWTVQKHEKSGAIVTDDRLRPILINGKEGDSTMPRAVLKDVFALGDCAAIEGVNLPATAQVANQKAKWLAKRLKRGDIDQRGFTFKDLGVMAYIGNWKAIMQSQGQDISGTAAWVIWRGAYLAKSVSWRNRILILTYWVVNFLFGRDVSRF